MSPSFFHWYVIGLKSVIKFKPTLESLIFFLNLSSEVPDQSPAAPKAM